MYNETKWYAEKETFRAVTGASANFPQGDGTIEVGTFPAKGTIPIAKEPGGTIISEGLYVRGTDTTFMTSVKKGDFIYDEDVLREVANVLSDILLELKQEFPTDISVAIDLKVCSPQDIKAIYAHSTHGSDSSILQEAPFRPGSTFLNGGAPISYDATAGEISFTVHK